MASTTSAQALVALVDVGPLQRPAPSIASPGSTEARAAPTDVFEHFGPPFDLTADMLLAAALCPTAPLLKTFPDVPFLSIFGRTPLIVWFSLITEGFYRDTGGRARSARETGGVPYNELNVLALLRRPALFVLEIYATSDLSIRIGHGYGMPKRSIQMDFQRRGAQIVSRAQDGQRTSFVQARAVGPGRPLGGLLAPLLPLRSWPIYFPSGSQVRGIVQATPRVYPAWIRRGRLALEAAWLPRPVLLLPSGIYLASLRIRLPQGSCYPSMSSTVRSIPASAARVRRSPRR